MRMKALSNADRDEHSEVLQDAALHTLGYYHLPGGHYPGSFTESLIATWERADPTNSARLAGAFPAMALTLAMVQEQDIASLTRLAQGQ